MSSHVDVGMLSTQPLWKNETILNFHFGLHQK